MSLATTNAVALSGLNGEVVTVEVDISDGLPGYSLLGLPDAALQESRDRVRAALLNSGQAWPNKKVTISLLPAWLPKSGSGFDLPIAITLLAASGVVQGISDFLFIGELSLEGNLRKTRGVLPSLICAYQNGIRRAVIPKANLAEAKLIPEIETLPFDRLADVIHFLQSGEVAEQGEFDLQIELTSRELDFSDVAGQVKARRAAEIAAAGGHNILLIGPPGVGKTMIAERIPTILPPLSKREALEVTAIHSITNSDRPPLSSTAPFISPHHSTTRVAMVGGGAHVIKPGACSLAHRGVLFIDEAPECSSGVLDSLRQPIESGSITVARANGNLTFPAKFILVLAANPCPCGKFTKRGLGCTCNQGQIRRYLAKLSGPLLDRIDLRVQVENVSRLELAEITSEGSDQIRSRVIAARAIAAERYKDESWSLNSEIPPKALRSKYQPEKAALNFLHDELDKERITARGLHKIIRTSWTIADLKGIAKPTLTEVKESYELREGIE